MGSWLVDLTERLFDETTPQGFDPRLVGRYAIDTGPLADRARGVAARLNQARDGAAKDALVVWAPSYAAITRRGPWVYVSRELADQLSDDGLAFVIAHEMAHHDLLHFSPAMVSAAWMGHTPRLELQADRVGVQTMQRAGFDPQGALEALDPERWGDEPPRHTGWWARFTITHPPLTARHRAIQALITDASAD